MTGAQLALLVDVHLPFAARVIGLFISEHAQQAVELKLEEIAALSCPPFHADTIRRALRRLVARGWIERRPGGRAHADRFVFHDAHRVSTEAHPIPAPVPQPEPDRVGTVAHPIHKEAPTPARWSPTDRVRNGAHPITPPYQETDTHRVRNGVGAATDRVGKRIRLHTLNPEPDLSRPRADMIACAPEEVPTATPPAEPHGFPSPASALPAEVPVPLKETRAAQGEFFLELVAQDHANAGKILAAWIERFELEGQLSKRDRARQAGAAKRLAEQYDARRLAAAFIGMGHLYPYSNGAPWDLFDLDRHFLKALVAVAQNPAGQRERRLDEIRQELGGR